MRIIHPRDLSVRDITFVGTDFSEADSTDHATRLVRVGVFLGLARECDCPAGERCRGRGPMRALNRW